MPFSDIFVKALTKVSASRKAYLRHLYIKFACYEENTFVSASEVFASKSDDSRKIIPGSLRIVFRIPVPPVEIPEATASERPALRLIRRIALSLTFEVIFREVFFVSEGHRKPETYRANLCD